MTKILVGQKKFKSKGVEVSRGGITATTDSYTYHSLCFLFLSFFLFVLLSLSPPPPLSLSKFLVGQVLYPDGDGAVFCLFTKASSPFEVVPLRLTSSPRGGLRNYNPLRCQSKSMNGSPLFKLVQNTANVYLSY